MLQSRPIEDLTKLAVDIVEGKVFTNLQIPDYMAVESIFIVLSLIHQPSKREEESEHEHMERVLSYENTLENLQNAGLLYEEYSKSIPMSLNGFPIFMSCSMLNKQDAEIVSKKINEYKALKEQFLVNAPEAER